MIEKHPSWDILDSSKIQEYMECERKYFFKYLLGWVPEAPNNHLCYGEGYHRSREHILINGYTPDTIVEAHKIFLNYYRQYFDETTDDLFEPKDPNGILSALIGYGKNWTTDEFEVVTTEIAGSVGLDDERKIYFRLDAIIEDKDGYWDLETKTGSREGQFWDRQWDLKMQVGTYSHVCYMYFGREEFKGVIIDGTFFKKGGITFRRVPIRKTYEAMLDWHFEVSKWMDMIEEDTYTLLNYCKESDVNLGCFVKRTENCTRWMRTCEYHDLCTNNAWLNPLQQCHEVPIGFRVERWDPRDREKEAKTILRIKGNKLDVEKGLGKIG